MIIYGWKRYVQVLAVLTLVCQQCALPAEHVLRRLTTKVTLFFIPLFPVSRRHTLACTACAAENKISREQADQLLASGAEQPPAQYAGPPTPPPQPAHGGPRYQSGPPLTQQPQQPQRPQQPMPAQPGQYGAQPPYGGQPAYQPGLPPMQRPYPGPPQPAAYPPPAGHPQQQHGYPHPPGR
jgi:hypothetical protein